MLDWQLQNENGDWEEQPLICGIIPSAAKYKQAILLLNNEIVVKLVSKSLDMDDRSFWVVGV